jgi:hypothetical protein
MRAEAVARDKFGDTKPAADREFYVGSDHGARSKRNQGRRSRGPGLELTIITTFPPASQLPTLSRCSLPVDCDISLLGRPKRGTSGCDSRRHSQRYSSCSSTIYLLIDNRHCPSSGHCHAVALLFAAITRAT